MIKDLKVTKGTVTRTILTLLVVVNIILKACGIHVIEVDDGTITAFIENLVSVGVIALSWWKNNSFSDKAKAADFYLAKLRNFDSDEVDDVFDKEGE